MSLGYSKWLFFTSAYRFNRFIGGGRWLVIDSIRKPVVRMVWVLHFGLSYVNSWSGIVLGVSRLRHNAVGVDAGWLLGFTDYHELVDQTYDDFADLISMGFTTDEAFRMTRDKFNRFGDMIMRLNYDNRAKVTKFCEELLKQQNKE